MSLPDRDDNSKSVQALEFLKALFGHTDQTIFLQTLANDGADPDEGPNKRHLMSRDGDAIVRFVAKHDRARRGLFVCVSTVAEGARTRSKETVRESICLHADLDFKGIAEDEPAIWAAIDRLEAPPSLVVRSGGGLHLYWLFREPVDAQQARERLETALRALAEVVAGDTAVCEIARLMRLPGSHNSKYGDLREVTLERSDGPRYELEGLEEWLEYQRPVLTRKPATQKQGTAFRPDPAPSDNPFLAAAAAMGRQPRLDVEQVLADMGKGNFHNSLLKASASLISKGRGVEETVAVLMEACRQKGDADWDWRRQEKEVRGMCASAQRKYAPSPPPDVSRETPDTDTVTVTDLDQARARRQQKPPPRPRGGKINHIDIGEIFLAGLELSGQRLMFVAGGAAWRYEDGLWRMLDDRTSRAWLDGRIEQCIRGTEAKSQIKIVNEARAWLIRHPDLQREDVAFDRHGKVPTLNGLIDPVSGACEPLAASHYCTWRVPFDYDPEAKCPYWLQLLEDAFADRPDEVCAEYIQLLQEWLGMALLDDRAKALSCILFFQGGSDYGKSEIINVLAGTFGPRRNTTPIDKLDETFGLMPFTHRTPWVLPEAFEQGKWHFSSVTKALASGEPIQINMKNGAIFDHTFTGPIIWGANHDPQFKEATAAIVNRLLIVPCRRKFDPMDPVGVALIAQAAGLEKPSQLILRDEMPGVLAWAVQGLIAVRARGYFLRPEESRIAAGNVRRDTNIVLGFVEDCVAFAADDMISVPDFSAAFASWWSERHGSERGVPGSESVGRAMRALAEPRVALDLRDNSRRYFAGICLNTEGRRHWSNAVTSSAFVFQSRKASTTESGGDPRCTIPPAWNGKEVIRGMRRAQANDMTVRRAQASEVTVRNPPKMTDDSLSSPLSPRPSRGEVVDPTDDIPF
jgi:phage/plasmid-associated DNA primase